MTTPPAPTRAGLAGVKNLHGRFHFATVRRPRPLLRRQLPTERSCRIDRSDAAGAGRPSVAPAEGYGPRFPRVGAVAASRRPGRRPRPDPGPAGYHGNSWTPPTPAAGRPSPSDPRRPGPPGRRRRRPRPGRASRPGRPRPASGAGRHPGPAPPPGGLGRPRPPRGPARLGARPAPPPPPPAPGRLDRGRGGRAAGGRPGRRRPGGAARRPGSGRRPARAIGQRPGGQAPQHRPARRAAASCWPSGPRPCSTTTGRPSWPPSTSARRPTTRQQATLFARMRTVPFSAFAYRARPAPCVPPVAEAPLPRRAGVPGPGRGQVPVPRPGRQPGAGPRLLHLRPDPLRLAHRRPRRRQHARPRRRRDLGRRPGADRAQRPHPDRPPPRPGGAGRAAAAGRRPRLRPGRRRLDRPLGAQGGDPGPPRPGRGRAAGRRPRPVAGGRGGLLVGRVGRGRAGARQPDRGQHRQRGRLRRPQPPGPHHPRDDPRRHPDPRRRRAAAAGRGVRRLGRPEAGRAPVRGHPPGPGPVQRPLRRRPAQGPRVPRRRRRGRLRRGVGVLPVGGRDLRRRQAPGPLPRSSPGPTRRPRPSSTAASGASSASPAGPPSAAGPPGSATSSR